MSIFVRVKNILLSPKIQWRTIAADNGNDIRSATVYLMSLALIPAVASFIGWGLIGGKILAVRYASLGLGLRAGAIRYASIIGSAYLTAYVFYLLAPKFGAVKNYSRDFVLVAYSYTALCIGGIFHIYWGLRSLAGLAALYSLVLLYWGMEPVTGVPHEKLTGYFVVGLIVMVVITIIMNIVFGSLFHVSSLLPY